MDFKKYIDYSIEDFTLDTDFMQWVLHPDSDSDKFWSEFLQQHPDKKHHVLEASRLIKDLRVVEPSVYKQRLDEVYHNVRALTGNRKRRILEYSKYAAILLFLVSLGGIFYYFQGDQVHFPIELADKETLEKGRIILPDGSVSEFENEIAEIQQTHADELTLNDDTKEKTALAQVVIPYGKRSEITLFDGTKIWLNSGSQLSYPLSFHGNSREVYLSGEAFFDVRANPDKPFYVITGDLKIRVTGTRFNVTSYSGEGTTQAVLLTGKIDVARNKRFARQVELLPGERIVYSKNSDVIEKDQVNVELYSSWIEGYLLFENEPVKNIFKKLERYYNQQILIENLSGQTKFTGKLDLTGNLEKVLNNIAFSASFSVVYQDGKFIVKP